MNSGAIAFDIRCTVTSHAGLARLALQDGLGCYCINAGVLGHRTQGWLAMGAGLA